MAYENKWDRNYRKKEIKTPCYLKLKYKLSLLFFDFEEISYEDFWEIVDSPLTKIEHKNYVILDKFDDKLPIYQIDHNPFTDELNTILNDNKKYKLIENLIETQKDIKDIILSKVNKNSPKTVILYIIDGLSYVDYIKSNIKYDVKPIFVNGEPSTKNGLINVIYGKNNIPIAKELQRYGYKCFGLTYWDRKNELTDTIFRYFTENNIFSKIDDIYKIIKENKHRKKYVQIYRRGLDELAHYCKDITKKTILNKIKEIFEDINELTKYCKKDYLIIITSDHGIKWNFEKNHRKGSHKEFTFETCFVPLVIIEG